MRTSLKLNDQVLKCSNFRRETVYETCDKCRTELECAPMPNVIAALSNIGGALCSTPQRLADAHYYSAVQ